MDSILNIKWQLPPSQAMEEKRTEVDRVKILNIEGLPFRQLS